jgi:hypothetical protein
MRLRSFRLRRVAEDTLEGQSESTNYPLFKLFWF